MTEEIIARTADYIKERLKDDSSGHDWFHTYRVWKLAKKIANKEGADEYIVELSSLLHDIADYKLHNGDEEIGPKLTGQCLKEFNVIPGIISHVQEIIATIPFKGAKAENKVKTLEGQCVQDADRLDAIGAIGIARCFSFGGWKGNIIYNPSIKPDIEQSEEEYTRADHTSINHFYEKLLLLKDRMNTKTGREIAEKRHKFMELFLNQFFQEWGGEI